MTERYSDPPANGRHMSTGEFRATPDTSANTAQFQAFAAEQGEPTAQWSLRAPLRSRARLALQIAGVLVLVALIAVFAVSLS
jgi:hypothetical protein